MTLYISSSGSDHDSWPDDYEYISSSVKTHLCMPLDIFKSHSLFQNLKCHNIWPSVFPTYFDNRKLKATNDGWENDIETWAIIKNV